MDLLEELAVRRQERTRADLRIKQIVARILAGEVPLIGQRYRARIVPRVILRPIEQDTYQPANGRDDAVHSKADGDTMNNSSRNWDVI